MTALAAITQDASDPVALPAWAAGAAEQPTKAAAVRFVCDHSPAPPTTESVRQVLSAAGIETTRPYVSGVVSAWRRAHGLTATGDVPVLSPSVLASLDEQRQDASAAPAQDASAGTRPARGRASSAHVQDASSLPEPTPAAPVQDASSGAELVPAEPVQDASAVTRPVRGQASVRDAYAVPVRDASTPPTSEDASVRAAGIEAARTFLAGRSKAFRRGFYVLATLAAVLLTAVVVAPISLSAQNIIGWAADPTGLNLSGGWQYVVFFALDAAAAVCVLLVILLTMLGRTAREFGVLVWAFCLTSAWASYSHGIAEQAKGVRDAWWAMPVFSVAGIVLFELIMRRARQLAQEGTGRRSDNGVTFPLGDWIPGVGALRETYGAWRLARLDGITNADEARRQYRALCPSGSVRVLRALRARDAREALHG